MSYSNAPFQPRKSRGDPFTGRADIAAMIVSRIGMETSAQRRFVDPVTGRAIGEQQVGDRLTIGQFGYNVVQVLHGGSSDHRHSMACG